MTLEQIKKRYKKQGKDWKEYKDDIAGELLGENNPYFYVPQLKQQIGETK